MFHESEGGEAYDLQLCSGGSHSYIYIGVVSALRLYGHTIFAFFEQGIASTADQD